MNTPGETLALYTLKFLCEVLQVLEFYLFVLLPADHALFMSAMLASLESTSLLFLLSARTLAVPRQITYYRGVCKMGGRQINHVQTLMVFGSHRSVKHPRS